MFLPKMKFLNVLLKSSTVIQVPTPEAYSENFNILNA